jgi:hypothetical protein
MALALGIPPGKLALNKHFVDTSGLLQDIGKGELLTS